MGFAPDITERLARARADLRMGVPVVLEGVLGTAGRCWPKGGWTYPTATGPTAIE